MLIDLATGWFKIFKVPTFETDGVIGSNDDYIDKSYSRVSHLFNYTCLLKYPRPSKVVFDNRSEFKQDFTYLLNYFDIKPFLTKN